MATKILFENPPPAAGPRDYSLEKPLRPSNGPTRSTNALVKIEEAEGGREQFLDRLQHATGLTPDEEALIGALADPRNDYKHLGTICGEQGISVGMVLGLLSRAEGAKTLRIVRERINSKLPEVAEDVVDRSVPHLRECPDCHGTSHVECDACRKTPKQSCMVCGDARKLACRRCETSPGYVKVYPDLKRQTLALSMLPGLLPQAGGAKQEVNVAIGVNQSSVPRNSVEWRTATDRLLHGDVIRAEAPVEAEVVSVSEPSQE